MNITHKENFRFNFRFSSTLLFIILLILTSLFIIRFETKETNFDIDSLPLPTLSETDSAFLLNYEWSSSWDTLTPNP